MKKITILLTTTILSFQCFCQGSLRDSLSTSYLQRGKNQKTAAWIMLGGGVGLIGLAAAVAEPIQPINICLFCENQPPQTPRNDALPTTFALAGLASIIGSIPMFIVAHHTKTKASSIGFKEQPIFLPGKDGSSFQKTQLAVVYKIQL